MRGALVAVAVGVSHVLLTTTQVLSVDRIADFTKHHCSEDLKVRGSVGITCGPWISGGGNRVMGHTPHAA
jgi:hypothetical protein